MPVRRVLIGFGSAGTGTEDLDMAGDLALALEVELAGLFVEEELLYQISELPTSSAIGAQGQIVQGLDKASISRAIAGRAQACRRALSRRAERGHLQWSFEIQHGEAASIIAARVKDDDILLITGTTASTTLRAKMELAKQMRAMPGANLIVPDFLRRRSGPVVVLHPMDHDFLDMAARVATRLEERLVLVARGGEGEAGPRLPINKLSRVTAEQPAQIAAVLSSLRPRLLVVSRTDAVLADSVRAGELLRAAGAPILLVNS